MTRATVEDSTADLGRTLRTGRPLVGGLSFHGVSGLRTNSLAHRLRGGVQAEGMRRCDAGLGLLLWSVGDPHALGGDQRGEQRGPDLKRSATEPTLRETHSTNPESGFERPKQHQHRHPQQCELYVSSQYFSLSVEIWFVDCP